MINKLKTVAQFLLIILLVVFVWLHIKPGLAPYFTNKGEEYMQKGELSEAIDFLKIATMLDSQNAQIRIDLGKAYKNNKQLVPAVGELRKAIDLNPLASDAYQLLAAAYLQQNNFSEAIVILKEGLTINPDNVSAKNLLEKSKQDYIKNQLLEASDAYANKEIEKAEKLLLGASNLKPSYLYNAYMVKNLPPIEKSQNDIVDALKAVIKANSKDKTAYRLLADLHLENAEFKRAIDYYRKYLTLEENELAIRNNLAICFNQLGKLDEAINEYRIALSLEPDNTDVIYGLASTYKEMQMHEEAINLYNHLIKIKPELPYLYTDLGSIYKDLGFYKKAVEYLNTAISVAKQNLINDTSDMIARLVLAEARWLNKNIVIEENINEEINQQRGEE